MEVEEEGVLLCDEFFGLTGVVEEIDEDDNNGWTTIPFSKMKNVLKINK
jgi:hypothetical protein